MEKEEKAELQGTEKERVSAAVITEILNVIKEKGPGILSAFLKELMSISVTEEQARQKARAVAAFYKELIGEGMDKYDAKDLLEKQFFVISDIVYLARGIAEGFARGFTEGLTEKAIKEPLEEMKGLLEEMKRE